MKNRFYAIMMGAALALSAANTSQAMSELVSLSTDAMWPTSSTPDNDLLYNVTTVGRSGSGLLEVTLSASNMPPGVTVTFSPSVLRFTGTKLTSQTAVMTVHCPTLMPLDCYPFTLTGTAQRESLTITNQVILSVEYLSARMPYLYIDNLGNGDLRLRGLGATGKTYQFEAKEDVTGAVWQPVVGSSTADGNGRFTFFTATATNVPVRYFRAVLPASDAAAPQ